MSEISSPRRRLARASENLQFPQLVNITRLAAYCELAVCVLSLSEDATRGWQAMLARYPDAAPNLQICNFNTRPLHEWQAWLRSRADDMTVLQGFGAPSQQAASDYVDELLASIQSELVVLA